MKLTTNKRKRFRVSNKVKKVAHNGRFRLSISRQSKNISEQIIDDIFIPSDLYDSFITKITYIKSLSSEQTDIEKNIFNFQKSFLKNLKDVYFSDNNFYLTVKQLENQINNNDLLDQEYKFIRGSLVTNDEYDLLNFDPLICNITNINSIGSLVDIFIPFATAKETLVDEKLPGPLLTNTEKFLQRFTLCFFIIFNMLETNCSLSVF